MTFSWNIIDISFTLTFEFDLVILFFRKRVSELLNFLCTVYRSVKGCEINFRRRTDFRGGDFEDCHKFELRQ